MPSEHESRFYSRVFALVTAAILAVAAWKILQPFIGAILWSILVAFPLFGTALIWVPAAGVLAVQRRWGAAIFMVAWGVFVVSGSDNVVRPLFISGRAQISTLPVFLGLAGGLSAFGPIGMVLGPVIVALVLALLRFAEESRQPAVIAAGAEGPRDPSVRVGGGDG